VVNADPDIMGDLQTGEWSPIEWCPWYLVHTSGKIFNTRRNQFMSFNKAQTGLLMVGLSVDGYQNQRSVAKLVAEAYIPKPDPEWFSGFDTIIHLNGDKSDCRVENLAWRPRWFAIKYNQERTDFPFDDYMTGPFECIQTGEVFDTIRNICTTYGVLGFPVFQSIFESQPGTGYTEADQAYVFPIRSQFRHYRPN
jgi:hypothetical protein